MMNTLPDTRPYPTDAVKNDFLLYAQQVTHSDSSAQRKLSQENLLASLHNTLNQKNYLGLSVAMSMAPDAPTYATLMDAINTVLQAKLDDEIQWFAMPIVIVAGAKQASELTMPTPIAELSACLANYPHLRGLSRATWLPNLICAEDFAQIKLGDWFQAKQNLESAQQFAEKISQQSLRIPKDQSVHVVYAVGYGDASLTAHLGQNLREAALPLMQIWQEALSNKSLTLFTNPLNCDAPLAALAQANHMRLRMALDVFAANSIRAIRLQSPRVGVVMAAREGGKLVFGFNASDSAFELQAHVFEWTLSPRENIALVQQNFLDLMVDCQVEQIRLLHKPLLENEECPNFAQALKREGHNPLFPETPTLN